VTHPKIHQARHAISEQILAELQERDPVIWDTQHPKPIKIGIHHDFVQIFPNYSKIAIRRFLKWWCGRPQYKVIRTLAEQGKTPRYDLWGSPHESAPEDMVDAHP